MSFALFLSSFASSWATSSTLVRCRLNAGSCGACILGCWSSGIFGMVWLVRCPMVMKWSFSAFAMSLGSLYSWPLYDTTAGVALAWLFFGNSFCKIRFCFLGFPCVAWRRCRRTVRFLALMTLMSWFLYCLCLRMLIAVGRSSLVLWSLCCLRIILLIFGSHQGLRRGFGRISNDSITFCNACCSCENWSAVVVFCCCCVCSAAAIALVTASNIFVLFLSYWLLLSLFSIRCFLCGGVVWNVVYIGRWSDSGGDIVPAVAGACVFVVSMTSMSVEAAEEVLYRVGVVMVV